VISRRAGCAERCTSGSEGGPGKRTGRQARHRAPVRPLHLHPNLGGVAVPGVGDDCDSRRIVGWALADHPRAELVLDALEMAVARRRPDVGLVDHSDRGAHYTSLIFTRRCRAVGIDVSMGSRGDCFDKALAS
jgi:transposase InsO family protein